MLTYIDVHNYTLVDSLDLEFQAGLTTLTGETGAGKSLLLDAIGLAVGNKSRREAILNPGSNAEVCATFDIHEHPSAMQWLATQELPTDANCLLKRVITPQGRSRCFINGRAVPLAQLQELGRMLVSIHGQNEHQALLKQSTQRALLDHYGKNTALVDSVQQAYANWRNASDALQQAIDFANSNSAHLELLRYQIEELDQLAVQEGEVETLEQQQKQAYHQAELIARSEEAINTCSQNDNSLQSQLHRLCQSLEQTPTPIPAFKETIELLNSALIHITEAGQNLQTWQDSHGEQPIDIATVDARISEIYNIARKHKVSPGDLYQHHQLLAEELAATAVDDSALATLAAEVDTTFKHYQDVASKLTQARQQSARKLGGAITKQLHKLSMKGAVFSIELTTTGKPSKHGNETPCFFISTIPNKPPAPIQKVASGGELSRISLAIQVETADKQTTPTLIFDEVDAGIGGETGDVVGKLLRQLGSKNQTLCVTHLAQVASKAHNHLKVLKVHKSGQVQSSIKSLKGDDIAAEVARMIGGPSGAKTSLNHAREMIANI